MCEIDCVPVPQLLEQAPYDQPDQVPSVALGPESVQSPSNLWFVPSVDVTCA